MSLHALIRSFLFSLTSLGMLLDEDTMCGEVKRTNISVINHPMHFCKKKKNHISRKTPSVLRKKVK